MKLGTIDHCIGMSVIRGLARPDDVTTKNFQFALKFLTEKNIFLLK